MTILTQLTYEIKDSRGTVVPNKSFPLVLKISESSPKYLIHKAIVIQDRNRRQGTASCKTRSEVRGGGKFLAILCWLTFWINQPVELFFTNCVKIYPQAHHYHKNR